MEIWKTISETRGSIEKFFTAYSNWEKYGMDDFVYGYLMRYKDIGSQSEQPAIFTRIPIPKDPAPRNPEWAQSWIGKTIEKDSVKFRLAAPSIQSLIALRLAYTDQPWNEFYYANTSEEGQIFMLLKDTERQAMRIQSPEPIYSEETEPSLYGLFELQKCS